MDNLLSMSEVTTLFLASLRSLLPSLARYTDAELTKKIGKEQLEDSTGQLIDYIESSCDTKNFNQNEYRAMLNQVLTCLKGYMGEAQIPVTIKTITQNIHLLGHSVEQHFPGYAASGLLGTIISPTNIKNYRQPIRIVIPTRKVGSVA